MAILQVHSSHEEAQQMNDDQESDRPVAYRISVEGRLDEDWSDWFSGMAITHERGSDGSPVTTLTGVVVDQAALRGTLEKIWNLSLALISVTRIERDG
jgi:hypothetical protein